MTVSIALAIAFILGLELWRRALDPDRLPRWVHSATWALMLGIAGGVAYFHYQLELGGVTAQVGAVEGADKASQYASAIDDALDHTLAGAICAVAAVVLLAWATWYARRVRPTPARVHRGPP